MSTANNKLPLSNPQRGVTADARVPKIINARVNKSCAAAFDGQFKGMHTRADFAVYPLHVNDREPRVTIQSDTRIGWITANGEVYLSPSINSGAHRPHLSLSVLVDRINAEEMFHLVACVSCAYALKSQAKSKENILAAMH